jgi:TetR/AcrR family transcriptional repressor of bet genes
MVLVKGKVVPKAVDRTEKRAEFVAASWNVIASEGLRAATLRRVASEAGCTTGSLTHYFPDRRSLLIDSLRSAHFQAGARMQEAAKQAPTDFERLEAVLLEALPLDAPRMREWRVWLAFWAEAMNDAELAKENTRRYAEWRSMLSDVVSPLVADSTEVERELDHLIALIDGLGLHLARNVEDETALEAVRRDCVETLARALSSFTAAGHSVSN